jgi:F420-0:gamma-glutamyl ligase
MGEGKEMQPMALIHEAPVIFINKVRQTELIIDPKKDIYAPIFLNLKMIKSKKNAKKR